jgi:hypothetical protein
VRRPPSETEQPARRATSITAKHAWHAEDEIAWLIAERCRSRVRARIASGSVAGARRVAAEAIGELANRL